MKFNLNKQVTKTSESAERIPSVFSELSALLGCPFCGGAVEPYGIVWMEKNWGGWGRTKTYFFNCGIQHIEPCVLDKEIGLHWYSGPRTERSLKFGNEMIEKKLNKFINKWNKRSN